jgi:erythronate-4-phosphate dehydrogenase
MIIAVDSRVPYWNEAFGSIGEVRPFAARKLTRTDLRDVDALVVRTTVTVNSELLEGTPVRFVGTATAGMDHLDPRYLTSRGIYFTSAAGSNANGVADYFAAALLLLAGRRGWDLRRKTIGVVGVGHVGSRVARNARAFGMEVLLCDPPLRELTGETRYGFLQDVLGADVLTFHVPLTTEGPYPTWHMVDRDLLTRLPGGQLLINAARGPVISGTDLLAVGFGEGKIAGAVLDVFEGEPRIDLTLVDRAELASAHIAGYSLDGKVRATEMILDEICRFFGVEKHWDASSVSPASRTLAPRLPEPDVQNAVGSIVAQAYDILQDDAKIRALKYLPPGSRAAGFDRLRDEYDFRPEFGNFAVETSDAGGAFGACLSQLGFVVKARG